MSPYWIRKSYSHLTWITFKIFSLSFSRFPKIFRKYSSSFLCVYTNNLLSQILKRLKSKNVHNFYAWDLLVIWFTMSPIEYSLILIKLNHPNKEELVNNQNVLLLLLWVIWENIPLFDSMKTFTSNFKRINNLWAVTPKIIDEWIQWKK